jgi:hypothetical protein
MTKMTAADREAPLADDILLTERIEFLLQRAGTRQLWMMFLDEDDVQSPVLLPCTGLPVDPGERPRGAEGSTAAELLAVRVADLMADLGLAQAVFAWERPGGPRIGDEERAWARELGAACAAEGARVRAQFLVHDRGVRVLAADDYA